MGTTPPVTATDEGWHPACRKFGFPFLKTRLVSGVDVLKRLQRDGLVVRTLRVSGYP